MIQRCYDVKILVEILHEWAFVFWVFRKSNAFFERMRSTEESELEYREELSLQMWGLVELSSGKMPLLQHLIKTQKHLPCGLCWRIWRLNQLSRGLLQVQTHPHGWSSSFTISILITAPSEFFKAHVACKTLLLFIFLRFLQFLFCVFHHESPSYTDNQVWDCFFHQEAAVICLHVDSTTELLESLFRIHHKINCSTHSAHFSV